MFSNVAVVRSQFATSDCGGHIRECFNSCFCFVCGVGCENCESIFTEACLTGKSDLLVNSFRLLLLICQGSFHLRVLYFPL